MIRFSFQRVLKSPSFVCAVLIVSAFVGCGLLLTIRVLMTRTLNFVFLPFNLVLAACPVIFSLLFARADRVSAKLWFGALWLLFFPNAPYIVTDLMHLTRIGGAHGSPLWLDILLVSSYAGAGLIFGYTSLLQMQAAIAGRSLRFAWLVAILSCFLAGFGIYLGRFLRWHSIHLFTEPVPLLLDVAARFTNPLDHLRTWGVTLGFGSLILFGYLGVVLTGKLSSLSTARQSAGD